jgi:ferritin-like metal-binding protein YciE
MMPTTGSLHDAFIDELRDAYDAERQLLKALARLAKAATAPNQKQAFTNHRSETEGHVARLEQVFESLGQRARHTAKALRASSKKADPFSKRTSARRPSTPA